MLGSVDLLLLPYGTALGAYTIWALLSEGGKDLFTEDRKSTRLNSSHRL